MPKIKEVYEYNNGSWENGTPIGADASNVDVALSDSTSTRDLQSVLGNVSVSDSSIKTQLSGKVDTDSGDIKDTVVSVLDPSSATDTSEDIDSTDVIVAAGEDQTTMWSKFNTFRKRVSNKFSNFLINSVEDVLEPSDTKTYSQAALNSYFADVIGYKTDADVASIGSVADQLSTLNNNLTTLVRKTSVGVLYNTWGDAGAATWTFINGMSSANYSMLLILFHDSDTRVGSVWTHKNQRSAVPLTTVRADVASATIYIKTRIVTIYDTYMQNIESSGVYQTNVNAYFNDSAQKVIHTSQIAPHMILGFNFL